MDIMDMNTMPLVEFTSDDLKSALASDYLDACTGKNRSAAGGSTSGGSASTASNVHGGWRMEGLGSTGTNSAGGVTNDVHSNNRHSFQSNRLHWDSVLGPRRPKYGRFQLCRGAYFVPISTNLPCCPPWSKWSCSRYMS